MRQTFLAAAAAALILSGGLLANRAEAMPLAAPSALGTGTATAPLVQAAVVCGGNGCAPVQTTRQRKRIIHPLGH